jgi:hypothetical protein
MSENPSSQNSGTKDTIDAQSGRFEFFKQSLTLGTAGLAGTAALFTDQSRVPTDLFSKIMVSSLGLSLTAVVAVAMMGLSTYANLLTAVARSSASPPPGTQSKTSPKTPNEYAQGVIDHARYLVIAFAAASGCLVGFAGVKLFTPAENLEAALTAGRQVVTREGGGSASHVQVERFTVERDKIQITFLANSQRFRVVVARDDSKVLEFVREAAAGVGAGTRP